MMRIFSACSNMFSMGTCIGVPRTPVRRSAALGPRPARRGTRGCMAAECRLQAERSHQTEPTGEWHGELKLARSLGPKLLRTAMCL